MVHDCNICPAVNCSRPITRNKNKKCLVVDLVCFDPSNDVHCDWIMFILSFAAHKGSAHNEPLMPTKKKMCEETICYRMKYLTSTDKIWALLIKGQHTTHICTNCESCQARSSSTIKTNMKIISEKIRCWFRFQVEPIHTHFFGRAHWLCNFRCRCCRSFQFICSLDVCASFIAVCLALYALSRNLQPNTNGCCFFLLHFTYLFCSRQRSTVQKGQVFCACVQLQYEIEVLLRLCIFVHRHPFLLPNTMQMCSVCSRAI